MYRRAIQASLSWYQQNVNTEQTSDPAVDSSPDTDTELNLALMLSEQQRQQEEQQRLDEQKLLEQVLQLSLTEK